MTKKFKRILLASSLILGVGGAVTAGILIKKKYTKQDEEVYKQLKSIIKILCTYDDYINQDDFLNSRDMIGELCCVFEKRCKKGNELAEMIPWFFSAD